MRLREEQVNACAKRRLCRRKELAFGQRKVRLTPRFKGSVIWFSLRKQLFALRSNSSRQHSCHFALHRSSLRCVATLRADQQSALRDGIAVIFAAALRPHQEGKCIHSNTMES